MTATLKVVHRSVRLSKPHLTLDTMTSDNVDGAPSPGPLSEAQRAALFSATNDATNEHGRPRVRSAVPSKAVLFVVAVFAFLGLGGAVLEHFFGAVGQSLPTATTTTVAPPATASTSHLSGAMQTFMGLREIETAPATSFALLDQRNQTWSLGAAKGKVVVLTFFDSSCADICPVEGAEIKLAQAMLGASSKGVDFVIVNADPAQLSVNPDPRALSVPGLQHSPSVFFVTGSLRQLNAVWIHYGLGVRTGAVAGQLVHNNLMYFISTSGKLTTLVIPFGTVGPSGVAYLGAAQIHRFATGIATVATSLLR